MNDISELFAKRLQGLEVPFSREWLADFASLSSLSTPIPLPSRFLKLSRGERGSARVFNPLSQNPVSGWQRVS